MRSFFPRSSVCRSCFALLRTLSSLRVSPPDRPQHIHQAKGKGGQVQRTFIEQGLYRLSNASYVTKMCDDGESRNTHHSFSPLGGRNLLACMHVPLTTWPCFPNASAALLLLSFLCTHSHVPSFTHPPHSQACASIILCAGLCKATLLPTLLPDADAPCIAATIHIHTQP